MYSFQTTGDLSLLFPRLSPCRGSICLSGVPVLLGPGEQVGCDADVHAAAQGSRSDAGQSWEEGPGLCLSVGRRGAMPNWRCCVRGGQWVHAGGCPGSPSCPAPPANCPSGQEGLLRAPSCPPGSCESPKVGWLPELLLVGPILLVECIPTSLKPGHPLIPG